MKETDCKNISNIAVTTSPPQDSSVGDFWIDTATMDTNVYTVNTDWVKINDAIDTLNISLDDPVEFEDCMPEVAKIEGMCEDYPGLKKAYENFKTVYKMVHQDWKGRQDDKPPF